MTSENITIIVNKEHYEQFCKYQLTNKCSIDKVYLWDTGITTINVQCDHCKNINIHNISHIKSYSVEKAVNILDFQRMEKRICDNINCNAHYEVYKPKLEINNISDDMDLMSI